MKSVRNSQYFNEVIKTFTYPYGELFVFNGFVVSEISEGITFDWKCASIMLNDVVNLLNTSGEDLIYISNRINSYSVKPSDWLKFFNHNYTLKSYFVISGNKIGTLNSTIEKLFFKNKIHHFQSLEQAITEAKSLLK